MGPAVASWSWSVRQVVDAAVFEPVEVAAFEDGQRIGTEKGRYEWWYFDAHLDDGATVVVVFYTKPNASPNGPLAPRITINLTLPDGRRQRSKAGRSRAPPFSSPDFRSTYTPERTGPASATWTAILRTVLISRTRPYWERASTTPTPPPRC